MTGSGTGAADEVVGVDEASALLEVTPDRIEVMVVEGMLTPLGGSELRFSRAEVLAARGVQLVEWQPPPRFGGRCGIATEEAPGERARRCPRCGLLAYPRLAPAVIMLVERDDGRALLARNAMFPPGIFSCLSGFVEPGETLEHAVRREGVEEGGLEVGEGDFRGSQPWPVPHQLQVGFGAQDVGGGV